MNARTTREMLGPALLGRFITTEPVGEYPGGRAKVIELDPDPVPLCVLPRPTQPFLVWPVIIQKYGWTPAEAETQRKAMLKRYMQLIGSNDVSYPAEESCH